MVRAPDRRSVGMVFLFLAIGLVLPGCPDAPDDPPLEYRVWVLESAVVDGRDVYPGSYPREVTVQYTGVRIEGDDGCNSFWGTYSRTHELIAPGPIGATFAACGYASYRPVHFDGPFRFHLDGNELIAIDDRSVHVYRSR